MKYLRFGKRMLTPSTYNQLVELFDAPGGELVASIKGSSAPNPQIPGNPDKPNISEYPIVAPGTYLGIFHKDRHHGRPCISINDDGPTWILQDKNPRTGAEKSAIGIRVHEGYSESWRGSAGCMTLEHDDDEPDKGGDAFLLKHFIDGEQVAVFIPNQDWFANA